MAQKEYQRLTGARSRSAISVAIVSRTSLWQGKDHLLRVDTTGYTETYKRFYFRDIQSMVIVATRRRTIWNIILLIPTVICLAVLANTLFSLPRSDPAAIYTAGVVSLIFIVPLLINLALGPTCTCFLRTAVQTEELPSLCRVRQARRILGRLRPVIAAVQGEMSPEEIASRLQGIVAAPAAAVPQTSPAASSQPEAPPIIS